MIRELILYQLIRYLEVKETQSDWVPVGPVTQSGLGTQLDWIPSPTGTQSDWHPVRLAPSPTGTQSDWYPVRLVPSPTGTQSDWHPVRLVPSPTGTQSDWYPVRLAPSPTGTQSDWYPVRLVPSPTVLVHPYSRVWSEVRTPEVALFPQRLWLEDIFLCDFLHKIVLDQLINYS